MTGKGNDFAQCEIVKTRNTNGLYKTIDKNLYDRQRPTSTDLHAPGV